MKLKINELAKLTGVTIRTLHYYDEIGLLTPSETTNSGYRLYSEKELTTLQQILFFRELDFPLNQIKEIILNPTFDSKKALENHKILLIKKSERINGLVNLIEKILKGETNMSFKEFDMTEIESIRQQYISEVKEKWGNTLEFAESEEKTKMYSKSKWKEIGKECNHIFEKFSENMQKSIEHPDVQLLVKEWQDFISSNFYKCTNEILKSLGQLYTEDIRFKNNIDKHREGLSEFISNAIEFYCNNNLTA